MPTNRLEQMMKSGLSFLGLLCAAQANANVSDCDPTFFKHPLKKAYMDESTLVCEYRGAVSAPECIEHRDAFTHRHCLHEKVAADGQKIVKSIRAYRVGPNGERGGVNVGIGFGFGMRL